MRVNTGGISASQHNPKKSLFLGLWIVTCVAGLLRATGAGTGNLRQYLYRQYLPVCPKFAAGQTLSSSADTNLPAAAKNNNNNTTPQYNK